MYDEKKVAKLNKWLAKGKFDKIAKIAKSDDPEARVAVAQLYGTSNEDAAYNGLIGLLHDRDLNVRMATVAALVAQKRGAAVEQLRHAYGSTSEPEFVAACKEALSVLTKL